MKKKTVPQYMARHGLTQKSLAERLDISAPALSMMLSSGREVRVHTLDDGTIELVETKVVAREVNTDSEDPVTA